MGRRLRFVWLRIRSWAYIASFSGKIDWACKNRNNRTVRSRIPRQTQTKILVIKGIPTNKFWYEIDTMSDLKVAENELRKIRSDYFF